MAAEVDQPGVLVVEQASWMQRGQEALVQRLPGRMDQPRTNTATANANATATATTTAHKLARTLYFMLTSDEGDVSVACSMTQHRGTRRNHLLTFNSAAIRLFLLVQMI
jgi:hypothetical protein